jgi:LysM repeat protein
MIKLPIKNNSWMKKTNLIATVFACTTLFAQAQNCPPSGTKGTHMVQKGETLYGIARSYGMKVAQIVQMNNLEQNTILQPCTELKITTSELSVMERNNYVPVSYNIQPKVRAKSNKVAYVKSNEVFHTVLNGETLEEIADKYGYTAARLMAMNNMESEAGFYVGQELRVSDCPSPTTSASEEKTENNPNVVGEFSLAGPTEYRQEEVPVSYVQKPSSNPTTVVRSGETGTPNMAYFNTSRYVPFYHIISPNENVENIARMYNLSPDEVMMMNNLKMSGVLQAGQKLMLEDRTQMASGNYITSNNTQVSPPQYQPQTQPQTQPQFEEQYQPQPEQPTQQQYQPPTQPQYQPPTEPKQTSTESNATAMNSEETNMANEINLVRSNPVAYIPYIEDYIKDLQKNGDNNAVQSAYELIAELRKTPRLSTLQPLQCLYIAARKHGNDQRKRGATDHQGSDGSWPWDRVLRECSDLKDGNENLVGGPADIRRAVILLLVDDGIEGRGHRKTTLNPDWKYVACHKMGTIGDMPNCWVQQYGF